MIKEFNMVDVADDMWLWTLMHARYFVKMFERELSCEIINMGCSYWSHDC